MRHKGWDQDELSLVGQRQEGGRWWERIGAESLQVVVFPVKTRPGWNRGSLSGGERALNLIKADGDGLNYLLSYATQWWKESGLLFYQWTANRFPTTSGLSSRDISRIKFFYRPFITATNAINVRFFIRFLS